MQLKEIFYLIEKELEISEKRFDKFNSKHEGYAIILEEVDELWDEIKQKKPTELRVLREALQVATMAVRFLKDLQ